MPVYIPRTKFRTVYPPNFRNSYWENWGPLGKIIGYPLILFGICLSVIEIVRILYGPTYRGITNYNDNDNLQFVNNNDALLFPVRPRGFTPQRVEKFHYWPWTYAANLFGLVVIAAGFSGVVSAYRRSYSSLFTFLTLSIFGALLSGYLIGYYSILINYYIKKNLNDPANRSDSQDTSFGLIGTNLAFSCASCLFSILGALASLLGIRGCTPKGLPEYTNLVKSNNGGGGVGPSNILQRPQPFANPFPQQLLTRPPALY